VDDVAFVLFLLTLADLFPGKRASKPRKQLPPFRPEPGPDSLGTHPLPPNPLERK
jgi:hypothetical protein